MPELPTTTWGTESDANRIKKTYVKGFMDVSGGELSVHNTAFNVFNSDGSGVFRINPRKITVKDDTGQEVDISLSYLTFLNNLVPADGQAVSIPEKVKYIFTSGTETHVGKSDASSNFRVYGNTYIEQFLFVSNDVSLNSNLYVKSNTRMDGDLSLNNRLFVSKDVSLNSNLYVKSNTRMDGDLSLNNRLFVSKDVSLNSNLYVKSNTWIDGDLSLNNRLFVSKDVSLNSNLYVKSNTWIDGDLSLNNRLFVSKDVSLNSNLYVKSNTCIDGDLSLNNRLFVSKDVSLNSNLYVKSNTRMDGDLSLNNRLFVSKDVSLNSNLYVKSNTWIDGDLSLNNRLFVSKDASLNGNLYVKSNTWIDGDLSLNNRLFVSKDVSLNSNLYVKSNTWIDGDLSLNNRLFVSKDVSLNSNLYVKSKSYFGSDVSLNGKFNMYGDASVNGLLLVSNDVSLNSNLYVKSKSYFGSDVSLNGNFTMYGDASINGLLLVSKDASLNGNLYVRGRTTFYEPSGSIITSGSSRGTLNLTHGDASGGSSILFQSVNSADDYAYIQYQENVPYAGQTSLESGLLTIGIENEITGVNRDRIALISANGSGNVGVNTKFPNYNLDVSGQLRICEGTGTTASATTGSMILEHTAVGGTSSIMFKGPNSTTNDYAYIQYEDNTAYTLPLLKYDFSANSGTTFTSTGSNTSDLTKAGVPDNITSVAVSGLTPLPDKFPAGISCIRFNQTNITASNTATIAYLQTAASPFTAGGFTFSAWIRPSTVSVANCRFYILNISPSYFISSFDIYIDGDSGRIAAICGEDSTNYRWTQAIVANTWYHYAFTFDNATSTGNHYLNGDLVIQGVHNIGYSGKQLTAINQSILMGLKYGYNNGGPIGTTGVYAKGFHGYMNYVNMFDRALSISEIAVLYNTPGYTQSTINRGLMTFGIENEPGAVFNDRIALMPANGSGFVGINTKTPTCALDVIGSINATGPLSVSANTRFYDLSNSFSGSTALKGGILVNNTGTGSRLILGAYYTGGIGSLSAIQSSDYYSGVEHADKLLLNPLGGTVGIGTKNPTYNLDVSGTLNTSNILSIGRNNTITVTPATNPKIEIGNGAGISRWKIEDVVLNRDGGEGPNFDYGAQSKLIFSAKSNSAFNGNPQDIAYINGMTLVPNSQGNGVLSTGVNVGIGTTNPFYRLSLGDLNANCKLAVYDNGSGDNWYGIGANSSNLTFGAGLTQAGTPQMVLSSTGMLGIGTTTPGSMLEVTGDARFRSKTYFGINDPGGGSGDNAYIEYTSRTGENTNLKIICNDGPDDHISLMPSGNVGINTLTPTAKLEVNGSLKAGAATFTGTTTISTFTTAGVVHNAANGSLSSSLIVAADIADGAVTEGKIGALAVTEGKIGALAVTEGKIGALAVTEGKIGALAVSTGKIAAGAVTTAKLATLDGTVNCTNLTATATITALTFNAASDYRIKTDVKPLDASFNIDVLKPVTYTNTRHGRQDVGFIAHEVQEHYPFLVNGEKDGEQMQSLNYIGLIGILTKEIQDLKRRLAETEAKVASVETDVRTIETKVEEVDDIIISVEDTVLSVKNAVRTVDDKVSSVENTVQKVENKVSSVENKVSSFDDKVSSVENKVSSFDDKVSLVENKVSSFDDKVSSVENTVLLEQARLTICETEIALNKSAIKDLDERLQS